MSTHNCCFIFCRGLLSCYCRPQNSVQVLFPISAWRLARAAAPPSPWPLEESAMKVA